MACGIETETSPPTRYALLGTRTEFLMPAAGAVYVALNDGDPSDNAGEFTVGVTVFWTSP